MKDRFSNGFIAGFAGGVVPLVFNIVTRALGFTTILWEDYMGVFMVGRRPGDMAEHVFFSVVQFFFLGVLGIIFALILPYISSKRHLFKGAIYGITIWYILYSMPYLLRLPDLDVAPLKTAIVNSIAAVLWGISLAFILKRIDNGNSLQ